jgi:hypothetical protein
MRGRETRRHMTSCITSPWPVIDFECDFGMRDRFVPLSSVRSHRKTQQRTHPPFAEITPELRQSLALPPLPPLRSHQQPYDHLGSTCDN